MYLFRSETYIHALWMLLNISFKHWIDVIYPFIVQKKMCILTLYKPQFIFITLVKKFQIIFTVLHFFSQPQRSKIRGIFFLSCLLFYNDVLLSETLTLLITFEQWGLELLNFTRVILVTRPFRWYHYFLTCDLDLWVWPIFKNIYIGHYLLMCSYWTWLFLVMKSSYWYQELAIFGIGHYREHLCFTNISCLYIWAHIIWYVYIRIDEVYNDDNKT